MSKFNFGQIGLTLAFSMTLSACVTSQGEKFVTPQHQYQLTQIEMLDNRQRADLFEAIIAADLAEQQQDHQSAMSYYLFAADLSKEQQLIEKSIFAAQAAEDSLGLEQAASIWLSKDPKNSEAKGLLLEAQLGQQNLSDASATAAELLEQSVDSTQRFNLLETYIIPQEPRFTLHLLRELTEKYPNEVALPTAMSKFIMRLANSNKNPENMLKQSLSKIEEALRLNPTFAPAVKLKSHLLFQLHQDEQALEYLVKLFAANPQSSEINQLLGQLLYDLRDFDAAVEHYKRWLTKHSDDLESQYYLAASYYAVNQYQLSLKHFQHLLKNQYQSDTAAFYCGDSATKAAKSDVAIQCFEQVKEGRFLVPARIHLSRLYAQQSDLSRAQQVLQLDASIDENEKIQLVVSEIDLLNTHVSADQAKQKLESALLEAPDNLALLLKKIEIYQLIKQPKQLLELLTQARDLIEEGEKLDRFNLAAAALINNNGHGQLAIDWLDSALLQKPDDKDLMYAKALYKESIGLYQEMVSEFKHLLSLYPDDLNIQNALGYTLIDQGKEMELAATLIEQAYLGLPDNPAVIDSKGWLAYRQGDLTNATKYLLQAFRLSPSADIAAHLGEVLWQDGKQQQAKEIWSKGMAIDQQNSLLIKTMERFKFEP